MDQAQEGQPEPPAIGLQAIKQQMADQCMNEVAAVLQRYAARIVPARSERPDVSGKTVVTWSWSVVVE